MNDIAHQRMVQESLKKKFGSHAVLIGKRTPSYPEQAERELQRVTNAYMRLLNKRLKQYLPEIKAAADRDKERNRRHDANEGVLDTAVKVFMQMASDLQKDMEEFGLYDRVEAMAKLTRKLSIAEWKKEVESTLGIDLEEDYYTGELFIFQSTHPMRGATANMPRISSEKHENTA